MKPNAAAQRDLDGKSLLLTEITTMSPGAERYFFVEVSAILIAFIQ